MMFATLDDLDRSVEVIVFGNALTSSEEALATDAIVLVQGRLDHKDREKTCLIAQKIERFNPTPAEVRATQQRGAGPSASSLRLQVDARALPASALSELKDLLATFPGECQVVIELRTQDGRRRLKLGHGFRVSRSAVLDAELDALLGPALVSDGLAGHSQPSVAAAAQP